MSKVNDGGAAYPTDWQQPNGRGGYYHNTESGMTLRDWFAGQAMNSAIEDYTLKCRSGNAHGKPCLPNFADTSNGQADEVAKIAFALADAMIKERNRAQ